MVPLTDNAVLQMLGTDRAAYGRIRLWGSVGFAVTSWTTGILTEWLGMSVVFVLFILMMTLCSLMTRGLPVPQMAETPEPYLRNLRRLFSNPIWVGFLGAMLLLGICGNFIFNFLPLYLDDLGAGEALYGAGMAMSGFSELPIFFFSALLIQWIAPRGLLAIAFLSYIARALLISILPTPETLILTQLLHGASFAAAWSAAVVYVSRITPPGLGATAQSVLGVAQFSIGGALGGWLGATLYDLVGPQMLFQAGALLAALGLTLFLYIELRGGRQLRLARARLH